MVTLLGELTNQVTATHRIWLRLTERYAWVDDGQNGTSPPPDKTTPLPPILSPTPHPKRPHSRVAK